MKRINVITLKQVREKSVLVETKRVSSPNDAAEIIHKIFEPEHELVEVAGLLSLNTKNEVVGAHHISRGTINAAIVSPREVFKAALMNNAVSIVLFHNHPSGHIHPSNEDIRMTENMVDAGKLLGVEVLDHIITGFDGDFLSLKTQGLM